MSQQTLFLKRFSTDPIPLDVPVQDSPTGTFESISDAGKAVERLCRDNAPKQAQEIIRAMEARQHFLPIEDYITVLRCHVDRNHLDEAHELILTMKQTPSRICFSVVANALIQANKLPKAKQILYNYMDRGIADTLCFNTIISAYFHLNRRRQAVALIHKMDTYARNGHPEARADKVTMTNIMQKLASRGYSRDAQELLERMWNSTDRNMQPDAVTYSLVFRAFANAPESNSDSAHELLQKMEERYQETRELSMRPNTVVYNSFLSVLARAGDGERAEGVLQKMVASKDLNPDSITYGTVLTAWKNACRGDKAEELLWRMSNPDRLCFSITIAALGKQGQAKRAEAILNHMLAQNLQPDTNTFTAVLNAWANAKDDPEAFSNVKRVLQELRARDCVVDTAIFNTFLKAIENAFMLDNKVDAVKSVLLRMKGGNEKSRPNAATYRQAISALAATPGDAQARKEALHFAMQIYQDRKNLPPGQQNDPKLHSAMLEACGKLSAHGKDGDAIVEQVFSICCEQGVVTSLHTRLLVKAASDELLKKIFNTDTIDQKIFHSIPKSWSRTIRGIQRSKQGGRW
jgi:pentatricopeptide repeat protein